MDNGLLKCGEASDKTDGAVIANLTCRVSAIYTGRNTVPGMSADMKHFGKRWLGRPGLARNCVRPDNVWDVECSKLIPDGVDNVHSDYFFEAETNELMRRILRGDDRLVMEHAFAGLREPG